MEKEKRGKKMELQFFFRIGARFLSREEIKKITNERRLLQYKQDKRGAIT